MNIFEQLKRDEGEVLHVYPDSKGIRTGGVGHNLEAHGLNWPLKTPISQEQSDQWLKEDMERVEEALRTNLPWSQNLDEARYGVLQNMCFNMGWGDGSKGLSSFHHTLAMIEAGNYEGAADAMLESKWSKDVGPRATRLSAQMRSGRWV